MENCVSHHYWKQDNQPQPLRICEVEGAMLFQNFENLNATCTTKTGAENFSSPRTRGGVTAESSNLLINRFKPLVQMRFTLRPM